MANETEMTGVVLWSDRAERSAVVWCEDHGDLAFYRGDDQSNGVFDTGDLIRFVVAQAGQLRFVREPRLVTARKFPDIAERLTGLSKPRVIRPAAQVAPVAELMAGGA